MSTVDMLLSIMIIMVFNYGRIVLSLHSATLLSALSSIETLLTMNPMSVCYCRLEIGRHLYEL